MVHSSGGEEGFVRRPPITVHDVVNAQEIEAGIRHRVQNYDGEERIKQITDFFVLNLIEVVFTKDPNPKRLQGLGEGKIVMLRNLTPGVIPPKGTEPE